MKYLFDKMLSSEINCSISSSQNAFHKYFATKLIKQQQIQIELNHLSICNNIPYYPHSYINSLSTLNDMIPSLLRSRTDWMQYW